jgi:hypothetical protein
LIYCKWAQEICLTVGCTPPNATCAPIRNVSRPLLDSYDQKAKRNADGSMGIYFGPTAPRGLEANWIPTVAEYDWFAYFRLYGLRDAQMRNDFHGGMRGANAFRLFKHLLTEVGTGSSKSNFGQMAIQWCKENGITFRQG